MQDLGSSWQDIQDFERWECSQLVPSIREELFKDKLFDQEIESLLEFLNERNDFGFLRFYLRRSL